jgi:hypothetical protein
VSWLVTATGLEALGAKPAISLQPHTRLAAGDEIFNNYGPKPNAELLLGYGFTLPENPDDTMVLKIGGGNVQHKKWEVGLAARGVEGLWEELLTTFRDEHHEEELSNEDASRQPEWAVIMDAADALGSMSTSFMERLPTDDRTDGLRRDVSKMIKDYVAGQRAILLGLMAFAKEREAEAVIMARREGVEVQLE